MTPDVPFMNTGYSTCIYFPGISHHLFRMKGHQHLTWDRRPSGLSALTNTTLNLPLLSKVSNKNDWSSLLGSQDFHFAQGDQDQRVLKASPTYIWASNITLWWWTLDHFPLNMATKKIPVWPQGHHLILPCVSRAWNLSSVFHTILRALTHVADEKLQEDVETNNHDWWIMLRLLLTTV